MNDIAAGLLAAAEQALDPGGGAEEVVIRRAVSSCYYAVYHALAKAFADTLIGGEAETRPDSAWVEIYRGLDHNTCFVACKMAIERSVPFPPELIDVASEFQMLQQVRHTADYDPRPFSGGLKPEVYLQTAKDCVEAIRNTHVNDLRAFAVWVLITSKGARSARLLRFPGRNQTAEQKRGKTGGNSPPTRKKQARRTSP